jgi:hypothetical protein
MTSAQEILTMIDQMDPDAMVPFFAEDATVVMGNNEPLVGLPAIVAANTAYLQLIKGIHHDLRSEWMVDATTIAVADVTYTRLDDKQVTIPAVSIWRVGDDGLIADFRVYYDLAPVFA